MVITNPYELDLMLCDVEAQVVDLLYGGCEAFQSRINCGYLLKIPKSLVKVQEVLQVHEEEREDEVMDAVLCIRSEELHYIWVLEAAEHQKAFFLPFEGSFQRFWLRPGRMESLPSDVHLICLYIPSFVSFSIVSANQ